MPLMNPLLLTEFAAAMRNVLPKRGAVADLLLRVIMLLLQSCAVLVVHEVLAVSAQQQKVLCLVQQFVYSALLSGLGSCIFTTCSMRF